MLAMQTLLEKMKMQKYAKLFRKNKLRLIRLLTPSLIVLGFLVFLTLQTFGAQINKKPLPAYADQVISACSQESYRPSCYDREIPKLMDFLSMEEAFQVTSLVQQRDLSYVYCHVLGHELSAREVAKSPDGWKEVVSRCPSGLCSNGCIHGGFQERFRAESLNDEQIKAVKPDLEMICEDRPSWRPTGLEQGSCYHALGHLTMYLTGAEIDSAVALCDEIAYKNDGRDYRQLCYDGAFMQIFQPLEPEDLALVQGKQPKRDQVAGFCNNFEGKRKSSCWTESWPLFTEELSKPEGLTAFCSKQDQTDQDRCYEVLAYVFTAQFNFDEEKIKSYCSGLTEGRSNRCFANAASRFIETDYRNIDKSVTLCFTIQEKDKDGVCFKELAKYAIYNFHPGSTESLKLCGSIPEQFRGQCDKGKL